METQPFLKQDLARDKQRPAHSCCASNILKKNPMYACICYVYPNPTPMENQITIPSLPNNKDLLPSLSFIPHQPSLIARHPPSPLRSPPLTPFPTTIPPWTPFPTTVPPSHLQSHLIILIPPSSCSLSSSPISFTPQDPQPGHILLAAILHV